MVRLSNERITYVLNWCSLNAPHHLFPLIFSGAFPSNGSQIIALWFFFLIEKAYRKKSKIGRHHWQGIRLFFTHHCVMLFSSRWHFKLAHPYCQWVWYGCMTLWHSIPDHHVSCYSYKTTVVFAQKCAALCYFFSLPMQRGVNVCEDRKLAPWL